MCRMPNEIAPVLRMYSSRSEYVVLASCEPLKPTMCPPALLDVFTQASSENALGAAATYVVVAGADVLPPVNAVAPSPSPVAPVESRLIPAGSVTSLLPDQSKAVWSAVSPRRHRLSGPSFSTAVRYVLIGSVPEGTVMVADGPVTTLPSGSVTRIRYVWLDPAAAERSR